MIRQRLFILLFLTISSLVSVLAKPAYVCDFEDATERSQWVLNVAATPAKEKELLNKWYIGNLTNSGPVGENALYISADGGNTIGYDAQKPMFVLAYRSLQIPRGKYGLYFNWLANGKPSGSDVIYVCFVPDDDANVQNQLFSSGNSASVPKWVEQYALDTVFAHALTWQYTRVEFDSDERPGKLIFVWKCAGGNAKNPPACIDNIEIFKDGLCPPPTNVSHTAENGIITLTWTGYSDSYTILVEDHTTGLWHNYETNQPSVKITDLSEGMFTFRIRGHCGDNPSPYVEYQPFIIYEGTRCIDYLTLNKAACYAGKATNVNDALNTYFGRGCVDHGYASIESRHTIHYLPNEYDPRTASDDGSTPSLKTVPSGELASVRIGNWKTGADAERIEYKYHVEEGASDILKIRYAVVLQSPASLHPESDQSHFKLDILDSKGNPIGDSNDRMCNSADFAAGTGDDIGEWYQVQHRNGGDIVFWKDWTDISVSLRNYIGQDLTIRLSVSDCTQGGHYGYAYFTLACESGEIKGLACGEEPSTHFEAPQGFKYRWYAEKDPDNILSTDYYLDIQPNDTAYYIVDVISKTNENCFYQLVASGVPHNPKATAKYTRSKADCQNMVHFVSDCSVQMHNDLRENNQDWTSTTSKVTDMAWDFGDGTHLSTNKDTISHAYPAEGGEFTATLYAYLSDRLCCDSFQINLKLPDIRTKDYKVEHHLCEGDTWTFNNKVYEGETHDTLRYVSAAGCDSLFIVDIFMHDHTPINIDTMICGKDMPFVFYNGKDSLRITESGQYRGEFVNRWKCDSIISLNIQIEPLLQVNMADTITVCVDGNSLQIPYQLIGGRFDSICISMGQDAIAAGFDSKYCFESTESIAIPLTGNELPGVYSANISYVTPVCEAESRPINIVVSYSASLLAQKRREGWVGILKNDYDFVSYQWYRDGILIPGATDSYLPVTDKDKGHSFTVLLTRAGEQNGITSCPIVYDVASSLENLPSEHTGDCRVYTITGNLLYEGKLEDFTAIEHNRIYIITYTSSNETVKLFIP